jgi:hypothetical protein
MSPFHSSGLLSVGARSKVTEFERRQLTAVQKKLDQEYEVTIGLNVKPS